MPEKPQSFALLPKIINGGIAGVIGISCVFPLDLVKTRLQNQPEGAKMYNSIPDAFKKTFQREGFFGMYRGAAVNILLITPEKAIKLAANDYFRFHFRSKDGALPLYRQFFAGGLAGFCKVTVTTPMELLKIQLQDAGRVASSLQQDGQIKTKLRASQVAYDLIVQEGIRGLYKGYNATLLRDVLFSGIYFPLFAYFNSFGFKTATVKNVGEETSPFWVNFLAGFSAGCITAFSVTPFDVVKTRLQTKSKTASEKHYTGIANAFTTILMDEGPVALFKGGACRIMVIAPLFAIAQVVYFLGVGEFILGYK